MRKRKCRIESSNCQPSWSASVTGEVGRRSRLATQPGCANARTGHLLCSPLHHASPILIPESFAALHVCVPDNGAWECNLPFVSQISPASTNVPPHASSVSRPVTCDRSKMDKQSRCRELKYRKLASPLPHATVVDRPVGRDRACNEIPVRISEREFGA